MKFITDLSKGVLGQADSAELWTEIIAKIPDEVLLKPDVKILSVACGHGTEAVLIAKRMIALGISKESVRESIWLLDKYNVFTNYVKLNYGFTNVITEDFLEWKTDMVFDVVGGNPPYQSGNGEKGGARSLWRKFIKKSFDLVKPGGYVSIICPGFPYQSNDLGNYFTENTPLFLNNDVSSYFPGIGSNIKSWTVRVGKHNNPFIVDDMPWVHGLTLDPTENHIVRSIKDKTKSFPRFECKQDKGYNSTQFKNDNSDYFETPTKDSRYPIRHASTVKVCYVKKPTECHNKRKVMMTFSGYPSFEYYDENTPMSSCYQMSGYIEVNHECEAKYLISLYNSRLYKFLSSYNSAGMKGILNYSLPKVDVTRYWTDQEIYEHFDLTQEEIDYVESNVK